MVGVYRYRAGNRPPDMVGVYRYRAGNGPHDMVGVYRYRTGNRPFGAGSHCNEVLNTMKSQSGIH